MIVVDSSERPATIARPGITVIHAPGANVPAKRNIALQAATGDAITWLDDDDWRHPDSLKIMAVGLDAETAVSGGRWAWFVDLATGNTRRFCDRRGVLAACVLIDTAVAQTVRFDEDEIRGSDIAWMDEILKRPFAFTYEPLSFFLCHDRNLGNAASIHHFNRGLDDIEHMTGAAWRGTPRQLDALRGRLWK